VSGTLTPVPSDNGLGRLAALTLDGEVMTDEKGKARQDAPLTASDDYLTVGQEDEFDLCDGASNHHLPSPDPSEKASGEPSRIGSGASPPPSPRPLAFTFPQTTLSALYESGQHDVTIPQCYPVMSTPSDFIGATSESRELLFQLSVTLGSQAQNVEVGASGIRKAPTPNPVPDWSVVHQGDEFDSDGEISYTDRSSEAVVSEEFDFADSSAAKSQS